MLDDGRRAQRQMAEIQGEGMNDRSTCIGSSEVYELLNYAQYGKGCARALAYRKLGAEPDFQIEEDDALFKRGHILEPIAASIYEELTGRKVRRPRGVDFSAPARRHRKYRWAGVHIDRLILAGHGGVTNVGDLEIKTRNEGAYFRVLREGPLYGDLLQPQWSMWITGHIWGSLAILGVFGGLPMKFVDMWADKELHNIFVREGEAFAETVWGAGKVPDPTIAASDQRCKVCIYRQTCRGQEIDQDELRELETMKKASRNLVQIDAPELARKLHDVDLLREERDSLDSAIEIATGQALDLYTELSDANGALLRGYGKVYLMEAHSNRVDTERLKAEQREIYNKYFVRRVVGSYLRTYPYKETEWGLYQQITKPKAEQPL